MLCVEVVLELDIIPATEQLEELQDLHHHLFGDLLLGIAQEHAGPVLSLNQIDKLCHLDEQLLAILVTRKEVEYLKDSIIGGVIN